MKSRILIKPNSGKGIARGGDFLQKPQTLPPNSFHPPLDYTTVPFLIPNPPYPAEPTCNQLIYDDTIQYETITFIESINNYGEDDSLTDWIRWNGSKFTYSEIDSSLYSADPVIAGYYDSLTNEGIGWLNLIERDWRHGYNVDSTLRQQIDNNDILIELNSKLLDSVAKYLKGQGSYSFSNPILLNYKTTLANLLNSNIELEATIANERIKKSDQTISLLNAAIANNLYEQNKFTIARIYLETIGKLKMTFNSNDSETVFSIATQCLNYGGPAVAEARILYEIINPEFDFSTIQCNMGFGRFGTDDESATGSPLSNSFASVQCFPNPASLFTTLNSPEEIRVAYLYDYMGKLIKEFDSQRINLENIVPGAYTLQLEFAHSSTLNPFVKLIILQSDK